MLQNDSQDSISFECPSAHADDEDRSKPADDFTFPPQALLPPTPCLPPIMPQKAQEIQSRTIAFQFDGKKLRYLLLLRKIVKAISTRIASMLEEGTTDTDAIPHALIESQLPSWLPKIASSSLQLYMYSKEAYVYRQIEAEKVDLDVEQMQLGTGCLGVFTVDLDAIVEACSEVICEKLLVIGVQEAQARKKIQEDSGDEWACGVQGDKGERRDKSEQDESTRSFGQRKRIREEEEEDQEEEVEEEEEEMEGKEGDDRIWERAHQVKGNWSEIDRKRPKMTHEIPPTPSPLTSKLKLFLSPPSTCMSPSCAILAEVVEEEVDWDSVVSEAYSWDIDYSSRAQLRDQNKTSS